MALFKELTFERFLAMLSAAQHLYFKLKLSSDPFPNNWD
jgi:hypothetical protein